MSGTGYISGQTSVVQSLLRGLFVIASAIAGLFILAASAAVAFFVVAGIVIMGLLAFAFFWARAKILRKPFGPKAHFEKARADMEAQFNRQKSDSKGPVIDAHRTPDGWSVDD